MLCQRCVVYRVSVPAAGRTVAVTVTVRRSNKNSLERRAGVCPSVRKVTSYMCFYLFIYSITHLFILPYIFILPASTIIHIHVPRAQSWCCLPQGYGPNSATYRLLINNFIS